MTPAAYDYLFATLTRTPTPHQALAARLAEVRGPRGVAVFAPQLGWAGNEAAVLVRWPGERGDLAPILTLPPIEAAARAPLVATVRPADDAAPAPGGIYVHRWFEVEAGAEDEFVALSQQGWLDFEARFDARIFGLFRAERDETANDIARLLLITRYGDHGVWEASRDPSTEAMRIFLRRQQLTRRSWAASSRLVSV